MAEKVITKIETQKRRKYRKSIYLDDVFAFGLNEEVVLKCGLKEGDRLSETEINEILLQEERKRARERALNFLAHRDRSEKEIRDKLKEVGYEQPIIDGVISDLQRIGLVDDLKFALSFARTKMATHPMGEYRLRRELKNKGISNEYIEKAIEEAFSEKSQFQVARELAERRKERYRNLEERKAKKKIADFLLRRGFNWEVVNEVLEG